MTERPSLNAARRVSRVLDDKYVDPILGFLLPGVGDLVGSAFGLYLVGIAIQSGLSPAVVARMLLNLSLDALFGIIPLAGDIGDVFFKANRRNLDLLERRVGAGVSSTPSDWLIFVLAFAFFLACLAAPIFLAIQLIRWAF